jgi:ABC-type multidrug transport system ATPase subunit
VLMEGRTTFVIAQRVSTVQSADQILVLDHGEIVGRGSHEDLLESNAIYAEIYRLQLMDESVEEAFGAERAAELVGATAWRAAHAEAADPSGVPSKTNGAAGGRPDATTNGAASNGHTTSGRNA